jgi:hypothetical protein
VSTAHRNTAAGSLPPPAGYHSAGRKRETMIREFIVTLSRGEIDEIIVKHLESVHPETAGLARMWTVIQTSKKEILNDDMKCPEVFSYHFADPL